MSERQGPESGECQQAVEHEQFVAEMVAGGAGYAEVEGVAEQGRGDGHEGYPAVARLAAGEHAEGEEAEQGAVGVCRWRR